MRPVVSVVICTRNRCESLAATLASIAADPSTIPTELVVADNASSDRTALVIAEAAAASRRPVRALHTPVRGHARVRNSALRTVRGEICLFTDDDVTVQPGWIDAIAHAFADPHVDAVGGRIIPGIKGAKQPSWMTTDDPLFRPLFLWDEGPEPFEISRGRYPIGANMAFRVARLPRDPFDPRFGHTGRAALGFDEWELFDRLIATHTVIYAPNAVVNHWIDGTRLGFQAVRRKTYQSGVGMARYYHATRPPPSYPRRVVRAARCAWRAGAARWRTRRVGLTVTTARVELLALQDAGVQIEALLSGAPRVSEWISTKV